MKYLIFLTKEIYNEGEPTYYNFKVEGNWIDYNNHVFPDFIVVASCNN